MASKTAIVVFLALVALQGTSGSLLDGGIKVFQNAVESVRNQTQLIQESISQRIANIYQQGQQNFQKVVQNAEAEIKKVAAQVNATQAAVQKCTNDARAELSGVQKSFSSGNQKCISSAQEAVKPIVTAIQGLQQEINATAQAVAKSVTTCKWYDAICLSQAGTDAISAAGAIGAKGASVVSQSAGVGQTAVADLTSCETSNIQAAQANLQQAITGPISCIQNAAQQ